MIIGSLDLSAQQHELKKRAVQMKSTPWREVLSDFIRSLPDRSEAATLVRRFKSDTRNAWQFFLQLNHREHALVINNSLDLLFLSLAQSYRHVTVLDTDTTRIEIFKEIALQEKIQNVVLSDSIISSESFRNLKQCDLIVLSDGIEALPQDISTVILEQLCSKLEQNGELIAIGENKYSYEKIRRNNSRKKYSKNLRSLNSNLNLLKKSGFPLVDYVVPMPDTDLFANIVSRRYISGKAIKHQEKSDSLKKRIKKRLSKSRLFDNFMPGWVLIASKQKQNAFIVRLMDWLEEKKITGSKMHLNLDTYLVTPKGMVLLKLFDANTSEGLLIKLPLNRIAAEHAQKHHENILAVVQDDAIPTDLKQKIPAQLLAESFGGQMVFVESLISGNPAADFRLNRDLKEISVGEGCTFIGELQSATAVTDEKTKNIINAYVENTKVKAQTFTTNRHYQKILNACVERIMEILSTEKIPVVREKGDYSLSNLLVDFSGHVQGVIDWDLSTGSGLPLIDLLNLLSSSARLRVKPQSFGSVLTKVFLGNNFDEFEKKMLNEYLEKMGLAKRVLPAFFLLFWLTNIAVQSDYQRKNDPRWMKNNFYDVLDLLESRLATI